MGAKSPVTPRLIGRYFFLTAAAVIAAAGWLAYIRIAPRMSWPITTAQVARSAVKYTRDTKGRRVFEPEIDLAYRVNGITYVTQTIGSNPYEDYPYAKGLVDASPVGKQDQIHYNPENPYEISGARYSLGLFAESLVVAAIGLAFGGIGWALFFFSRPKHLAEREQVLPAKQTDSRVSRHAVRWDLLIVGGFALIGLGLIGAAVAWVHNRYTIRTNWPAVDAEVTASEVVSYRQSKGERDYKLEIEFRYSINGKQFVTPASTEIGTTYSLLIFQVSEPDRGKARAYRRGTHHSIRYNPQDPNDVRFDLAYDFNFLVPIAVLAVLGLGFTAIGVGGMRLRVKHSEQRIAKGLEHESV